MDNPSHNSVSEENSCEVNIRNLCCEEYIEHKQCASNCMTETGKSMVLEVLATTTASEKDALLAHEAGSFPNGVLCDYDLEEQPSGFNVSADEDETVSADEDETVDSEESGACQEFSQSISVDPNLKDLRRCVTFPRSAELQQKNGFPSTAELPGQFPDKIYKAEQGPSAATGSSSYARSVSLPSRFELVSAMKGGRAQNGVSQNEKLHVKWAPEVYDPLVSSMSHTVQNRLQRPKAKKKDKHKNTKGKSSRGSHSNEKKSTNRKNIGNIFDPRDMSLEATRSRLLRYSHEMSLEATRNRCAKPSWEELASNGLVECRPISFLNEGLAKMHLSIS